LLLYAIGCGKSDTATAVKTRPPPLVVVEKIEPRDVPVEVRAPVDLRPLEQADVGSKILGYIDAVLVDRGDRVKKGQLIALVRPSDLPDQLAAARGSLAQTEASAALARTNFERAQKLAPTGVVSEQEVQQSSAALASAEAAQAAAKAQIGALAVRIGETRIESPIDGLVSQRRLDPGALVGPPGGGAIITVVRVDRLRVFITVNEHDAPAITVGKEAHVELDALPGKSYSGLVVRVAPSFDPVTRTLDAEVQLANDNGELRPGMYGRAAIRLELHPHVPVVSVNAVQITENQKYVFVLNGTKVTRRPVRLGADVADAQLFEVTQGLTAGEEVVTAGADGLSDGATVRVARDVDPYSGAKAQAAPAASSGSVRD
jgi:RND family efflux transporter MFP subunit